MHSPHSTLGERVSTTSSSTDTIVITTVDMATPEQPEKDLKKLEAEQEKEDADLLHTLEKEGKEFDKVNRYDRKPLSRVQSTNVCNRTAR